MNTGAMVAQRTAFGKALVEIAPNYPRMIVLDPDVCTSTQTSLFRTTCPDRFYATGIAEANTVGMAAGLVSCGYVPWVSAFAVFLSGRAFDQIRASVAHPGFAVKLNGSYGGLPSGRGGATHSALEDIALMRAMPNMTILTPADAIEVRAMTDLAMRIPGPVYLRTVRCDVPTFLPENFVPEVGRAVELAQGNDVALLAEGMMSYRALEAAKCLNQEGIAARVLHFGSIKPIDRDAIEKAARECGSLITIENHSVIGGLGGAVCEVVAETFPCSVKRMGFPDIFLESGDDEAIFARHGLNVEGIAAVARSIVANKSTRKAS